MTDQRKDEWQPIETAPKDGTHIQVGEYGKDAGFHAITALHCTTGWMAFPGFDPIDPTHWQPLPAPPTEDRSAQ